MRILLDECVDWRLSWDILGHDVSTAHQMGWTGIENGELLAPAAKQFDAFVTVDRNLSFQQNLTSLPIAIVVRQATTNRLIDLKPLVPELLLALDSLRHGALKLIGK